MRLGTTPAWRGEPLWPNCAILHDTGIPCVPFGADSGWAHAASEWTTTASVEALADIFADIAIRFCNAPNTA